MKSYSLIIIIICCICRYTSIGIKPELKWNIFNFGYEIDFEYDGMLAHSFNRFYVVTKLILLSINDLRFSTIKFDKTCNHLQEKNGWSVKAKQFISDLIIYCRKIVPIVHYYREQISSFNCTAYNILTNEILLILPKFPKVRKEREVLSHH